MKRARFGRRSGLPREAEELIWLASGRADSGSRTEDVFWESRLAQAIDNLLHEGAEDTLNAALDHLYALPRGYDELADILEARAETGTTEGDGPQVLLIAAPVLAWSRFSIPSSTIPAALLANLRVHLAAHVLAGDVSFALANVLFSPDQLPQGYSETARFAAELGAAAAKGANLTINTADLPETSRFLSDVRYLLAAVVVKPGGAIFRWQEADCTREQAARQWASQGGAALSTLLAGCATELVLPDAYFAASREADRASRPYSIRASVAFLATTLDVPPSGLRAVVAPFYENQLEEFRIAFTTAQDDAVVHGVVWPLIGAEDDRSEIASQIEAALRECGVTSIVQLDNRFPMEYCDDCGAPMYPTADGETAHAELPEDMAEQVPRHLH
ncbi:DUF2863 family protein [Uliginosibacterium sp. sgz301328]|uniref:DUF2863 family protein n=1 Tax=Uliginosibacterium sp. sgz301328 TaxID=3243764 RepID=UPI00359E3FD0